MVCRPSCRPSRAVAMAACDADPDPVCEADATPGPKDRPMPRMRSLEDGRYFSLEDLQHFHRQILADVQQAMIDGQRQLQREWMVQLQQLQRQQLDCYTRSVERLLLHHARNLQGTLGADGTPSGDDALKLPCDSDEDVRPSMRHHTWHQSGLTGIGSPQQGRLGTLQLPAGAVRALNRAQPPPQRAEDLGTPGMRSVARGPPASKEPPDATSAEGSFGVDRSGEMYRDLVSGVSLRTMSPHQETSSRHKVEEQDVESKSDLRSEENERWKHQWNHHMRASLTKRLGTMRTMKSGIIPHKVSGMLGMGDLPRKRVEILPRPRPRSALEKLVDSHMFHMACGVIIVANAIFIGVQTDVTVHNAASFPPVADPTWMHVCSLVFTAEFGAEVLIRIVAKGWRFLFGDDWKWNVFDLLLVIFSVTEELLQGYSLTYTRLLRGFRMVRVLRVIRVMRFFRELRLMVCSIVQSLVSLSWALVLLLLVMYLFTICFMHGISMYLHDGGRADVQKDLVLWYGSIGDTMFALLLAVTGGEDWIKLVEPLSQISVFYQVLFSFYVLFVIIGVLNVLTSAFVQRACELSRLDRDLVIQSEMISDEAFLNDMKGIFEEVDEDGTGRITWEKFRQYLQNDDVQAYFATQQLDTTDARELFNLLDVNKNEEVGIEEFIMGCKRLRGQAKSSDMASLLRENKRAGAKSQRQLRKVEAQVRALRQGLQVIAGVDCSHASWLRSPTSVSSCPHTPGSAM